MNMRKIVLGSLALALVNTAVAANDMKAMEVKDVETLNDNITQYQNKKVTVQGEVSNRIDSRSAVIESGGIFDDEIVIIGKKGAAANISSLKEDSKVKVTGTIRSVPIVEIEKEYGWDLNPELEVELENVKHFLVVDDIKTI